MLRKIMTRQTNEEQTELEYRMDFRKPEYRREVFLRFYEFHLKYAAHPGGVYYAFPYIFKYHNVTQEQKYWFCFINGASQNVLTTYEIFSLFPDIPEGDEFAEFYNKNYKKFGWDTDRKWVKAKFLKMIENYKENLNGKTQVEFFENICSSDDPKENFRRLWDYVINNFAFFGRLSTFSYLEYLKIAGLNIDCDSLFLSDIDGSKSHRNGLCKVLGRDDLDWHDKYNPDFKGYTTEQIEWLQEEGALLLEEAKERIDHADVGYFTLESTLCCFKSWFRPNRRYPNVYNDMFFNRIKKHEDLWNKKMPLFWQMRKECLPEYLCLEDCPNDPGLAPIKQNHFRNTGQVIMMDREWHCFKNDFNDFIK
jgi:hypothetical protein